MADTKTTDTAAAADPAPDIAAKPVIVDLTKYDDLTAAQNAGLTIPILDPRGNDTGIIITVAGPDSEAQRKSRQKEIDARLRDKSSQPLTGKEMDESGVRMLAGCVLGWNNVQIGDATIPMTFDAAVALFQRFPWIREQVDAVAGNRAGFLKS